MLTRSFIAINLDEEIKRKLISLLTPFKKNTHGFSYVPLDNIHLTLRFLGSIDDRQIEKAISHLIPISFMIKPFTLEFNGLMAFPNFLKPIIIGTKVRVNKDLNEIYSQINIRFNSLKIGAEEKRSFKPHLTLARADQGRGESAGLEPARFNLAQKVKSFELMGSNLLPAGAKYEIIQSFPLCQK